MYSLTKSGQFKTWMHLDADGVPTGLIILNTDNDAVQALVDQLNQAVELRQRIAELEAQLAELTAPKLVICNNCNSVIEGEIHLRYMAHDTISLCGACVTENED